MYEFCIYKFVFKLKYICNLNISIADSFAVICQPVQSGKNSESPGVDVLSWGGTRQCFAFLFQLSDWKEVCPFMVY